VNIPLITFVVVLLVFLGVGLWFFRGVINVLGTLAADHARVYAVSYIKGAALIAIAAGACFTETFSNLTAEEAARLSWWSWMVLFWKPIAAGLATMCAFLDRSAERARDDRSNTPSPFPKSPPQP